MGKRLQIMKHIDTYLDWLHTAKIDYSLRYDVSTKIEVSTMNEKHIFSKQGDLIKSEHFLNGQLLKTITFNP